jgi:hypothetical protein
VRRDVRREGSALVVCLSHEPNVAETQVAQAAVDELRRRARGTGAEVTGVDERDGEPRTRGVGGGGGADHPAADHEQVERPRRERLSRCRPALGRR